MNPTWFDETTYLLNKLDQLRVHGQDYASVQEVRTALQDSGMTPYQHFLSYGEAEGVNPNLYFNKVEYLEAKAAQLNRIKQDGKTNWDSAAVEKAFAASGMTAVEHFNAFGWQENVNPSNLFDVSTYLEDKAAQMGNGATVNSLKKILAAQGFDPVTHYMAFGKGEGLQASEVPAAEQVPTDPGRPRPVELSADGKTITLHLQSPVVTASIEKEDFTVRLGDTTLTVDKIAAGTGKENYDIVITLAEASRVPGLSYGEKSDLWVDYDPNGGPKTQLTTAAGPVLPFDRLVDNHSQCFQIAERVSTETRVVTTTDPDSGVETSTTITISTLNLSLTPPASYVPPTTVEQFVKVDLSATTGVVSGGAYGLVTSPRLMDGKLVQKLDATGVNDAVSLNIVAGTTGIEITTSDAGDHIALGAGADKVNYTSLRSSQLDHMDTIEKFTCGSGSAAATADKLYFGNPKVTAGNPLIDKVIFMGPLSLEGQLSESSIQGVFWNQTLQSKTAYLLQNGKDYVLVADGDGDGVFTADGDFALQLQGVTGMSTTANPGADLTALFL